MMIKNRKYRRLLVFSVVIILLIFLHIIRVLSPVEDILLSSAKPLSAQLYHWSSNLNNSYQINRDTSNQQIKIEQLAKEVAVLTVANSQCLETKAENDKLRSTLKFLKTSDFQAVTARIIAKQSPIDNALVIDRGRQDGLRPGLGVVSDQGVIVGKVVKVKDTTASICLTTDSNCQLAAMIQNKTKTPGITVGNLGLTIKMNYIPQLDKVSPGDMVITSGLGGNIPRGLLIGKISQVNNASNQVWQNAIIEPILNLDNLTIVSVIIS